MDAITDNYAGLNTKQVHDHATALTVTANHIKCLRTSTLTERLAALLSISSLEEYFFQINTYFTDAVKLELFDAASLLLKNSKALSAVIQEIIAAGDHLANPLTLAVRYCAIIDACEAVVWNDILPAKQLQHNAAAWNEILPAKQLKNNTDHEQPLL
jgi:hypothetical protein